MSKIKKYILMIVVTMASLILFTSTKAFATDFNDIDKGTISIDMSTMAAADDIYCVAHTKGLRRTNFKTIATVEITGSYAKFTYKDKNGNIQTKEVNDGSNAIIASILGGNLKRGYGSWNSSTKQSSYNEAQQALYGYWNTWVDKVGKEFGFQKDTKNDEFKNVPYLQKAKNDAIIRDYKVTIYLLHEYSGKNWQELIGVKTQDVPDTPEPEPGQTEVTGYININGYVWEDIANSKSNTINSKYEDGDLRVSGIKVHWKAADGTELATTTTDQNGAYKLTTTIALYNHPYGIKDKTKYDQINNSYIEFEYNGLKYTTVAYNGNLSAGDTSKGKEDANKRSALDAKFDKVENQAVYDGNQAIISGLPNTQISDANYTPEFAVSASTLNIARNLMSASESNSWTEKKEFCIDHCQVGEGPHVIYKETYGDSYIKIYCNGQLEISDDTDHWSYEYKLSIKDKKDQIIGDAINTSQGSEAHYYSAGETNGPTYRDCRQGSQEIYIWNINNMNLGLVRREQPDAAISSDIEKVRVIMKNQEYTYEYGNRGIQNNDELYDYKVKFGNKYMQTYTRAVNPADIAYVNYNNTDDLKVYVTYNIILKNQSNTLPMTINSIVNYYDADYTIYRGEGNNTASGWQESNGNNNGFKIAYNQLNITLQPGTQSNIIKLEFEVSQSKIKELQNQDAGFTFTNYTEIFSFTTLYGENTICAERETAAAKGKTNQQYAGLDADSTPGNAVPGNESTYEDDTDRAPSFLLKKDPNYKTMSGIVYEDTQTEESKKDNERLGNGVKDGKEKGVQNVKVELIDPTTGETAYLYYKDQNGANRKPAVTYSDSNGNYSFGDGTTSGVVVDKYIIKYTYGNADGLETTIDGGTTHINARNYKSTIITDSNVKNVMTGNNSNKWHLYMNKDVDVSIAIDDMKERLEQDELKNATYYEAKNMSAYSKEFDVQLEYTENQTAKVDDNGGNFASDWSVFDFGIIERPREDVIINKTISKVKLTLGNGQVLLEGDPRTDKMNYVKPLGLENRSTAKFAEIDAKKALSIEMDQELVQGSTLEVWYLITLTNNSEKDYNYETNSNYYYYGTDKQGDPLGLANLVVDYMSSSMVCKVGDEFKSTEDLTEVDNTSWRKYDNQTAIDAEYLKNNGYISYKVEGSTDEDQAYETIKNRNMQSIVTNKFANILPGQTETSVLYASKLLTSQDDDSGNVYENHVEILELNSKTGRTIKNVSDDTRTQVDKEYQPGNYIANLNSTAYQHQQDDDNVKITITPPTGTTNYTTIYIISAVIGLIVISGGIILIKKRFIKK